MPRPEHRRLIPLVPALVVGLLIQAGAVPNLDTAQAVERNPDAINKRLKEVEKSIKSGKAKSRTLDEAARQLREALEKSRQDRIAAARKIQRLEDRTNAMEDEIADLKKQSDEKAKLLETQRAQFAAVLAALQRLSQLPPGAVIARPEPPTDLVRSAILLRSTVPRIEAQAAQLRKDLIELAETRQRLAERRVDLARSRTALVREEKRLDALLARTREQHRSAVRAREAEAQRLQTLAREAQNLRELFGALLRPPNEPAPKKRRIPKPNRQTPKRSPGPPEPADDLPSITADRGNLTLPAAGRIVHRYGEAGNNGLTQKGITIATRDGARVVALHAGTIVFAGPFRGYGKLLIIAHGEGYHSLLAGLSRIDGILGQSLKAGEPVGVMGHEKNGRPSLYLELRRKGQPINPMPWLRISKGKASG